MPSSAYMAEAITSVIGCSHRTILVISENYLTNDWCRFELESALRESQLDKAHKIIAVVLDPKCLSQLEGEMRSLLTTAATTTTTTTTTRTANNPNGQQMTSGPLLQLDSINPQSPSQLIATLTKLGDQSGTQQQVSTQPATKLATQRINFISYSDRKFWPKLKASMPAPRPSSQSLTLTTKN